MWWHNAIRYVILINIDAKRHISDMEMCLFPYIGNLYGTEGYYGRDDL